ncbi:hypothetical protein BKA56DRAFT_576711 [Ilyonectria sp. MPI-CAGE-AT-0026]|nr:hypothetical protein BKA56DRAFT_576711 [Ilyonectria sp. MPI-CAGE-AT-0026]
MVASPERSFPIPISAAQASQRPLSAPPNPLRSAITPLATDSASIVIFAFILTITAINISSFLRTER